MFLSDEGALGEENTTKIFINESLMNSHRGTLQGGEETKVSSRRLRQRVGTGNKGTKTGSAVGVLRVDELPKGRKVQTEG